MRVRRRIPDKRFNCIPMHLHTRVLGSCKRYVSSALPIVICYPRFRHNRPTPESYLSIRIIGVRNHRRYWGFRREHHIFPGSGVCSLVPVVVPRRHVMPFRQLRLCLRRYKRRYSNTTFTCNSRDNTQVPGICTFRRDIHIISHVNTPSTYSPNQTYHTRMLAFAASRDSSYSPYPPYRSYHSYHSYPTYSDSYTC